MKRKTLLIYPLALAAIMLGVSLCLVDGAGAGILAPPQKVAVYPPQESHTAGITTSISITYDQDMDPLTVNPQTFAVHARQTGWLTQTLSVDGGTIMLQPMNPLHAGELVQVSATTQTLSLGGEGPITPTVWQFTAAPWNGNAYFHQVQTWEGIQNRDIALGNLDGDGDLDMLTTSCGYTNTVRLNDGSGIFSLIQEITLPDDPCILDAELGDLDGDGDLDALFVSYELVTPNRILFNNGDGTFTLSDETIPTTADTAAELGDLDRDGDLDIFVVAGGFNLGSIRTWFNDGSGAFILGEDFGESSEHIGVALADVDLDGDLDAFSATWDGTSNKVWLNDGMGGFNESQVIPNSYTVTPLLGDLNGDGYIDIYLPNGSDGFTNLPDEVWLNDGTGHFTDSGQRLYSVAGWMPGLGDLDADGDLDVYLSDFNHAQDEVWLNDGLGNFSLGYQINKDYYGAGAALGDLDADGDLDAVTDCPYCGHWMVLLNGGWLEAEPILEAMGGPGFTQCSDDINTFYLVGGGGPNVFQWRNQVYRYDAVEDEWTQLASLPQTLFGVAASCYEGKIYAAGGWRGYAVNTLYIYDIATNTWTVGANLPRVVSGAALGAWDGKLYLVGGSPVAMPCPPVADVDIYDIQTNTWSAQAGQYMLEATAYPGWVQRGAYLYVVGGLSGDYNHNVDATQSYDLSGDAWELGPTFYTQRSILAVAATQDHLYAIGGDVNGAELDEQSDLVEDLDLSLWPGGVWTDIYDPIPQAVLMNVGFCTEAMSGGEIWSVGGGYGIDPNYTSVDTNLYRPSEPCYDFYFGDLAPESWELSGRSEETVVYTLTLYNDGTITDTYDLSASAVWTITIPSNVGPLEPGESAEFAVLVTIPEDALPDDQDLAIVTVTSQGDPAMSDQAELTTTAEAFYDVELEAENPMLFGWPDVTLTYTLTLTNLGNLTDTFVLGFSGNLWEVSLPVTMTILSPFESMELLAYVTVPADAKQGDQDSVTITAISQGDTQVSDQAVLISTAYGYGVIVTPESDSKPGAPGEMLEYTLTVTNTGSVGDEFSIELSGNTWTTSVPTTTGWLEAGEAVEIPVTVNIPPDAPCDVEDVALLTLTSAGDPEVSASSTLTSRTYICGVAVAPESAEMWGMPGDTLTYTLLVTNTGEAGDFFTIVVSGNLWTTEAPTQTIWLEAGVTTTVQVVVSIPLDAVAGEWDVALLTFTSGHDAAVFASATLTSRVPVWYTYLPMVSK